MVESASSTAVAFPPARPPATAGCGRTLVGVLEPVVDPAGGGVEVDKYKTLCWRMRLDTRMRCPIKDVSSWKADEAARVWATSGARRISAWWGSWVRPGVGPNFVLTWPFQVCVDRRQRDGPRWSDQERQRAQSASSTAVALVVCVQV